MLNKSSSWGLLGLNFVDGQHEKESFALDIMVSVQSRSKTMHLTKSNIQVDIITEIQSI